MARTAVERLITFDPSSQLTDYLGVGYSTKGVALASLMSLSPIYPSRTILQLKLLKQNFRGERFIQENQRNQRSIWNDTVSSTCHVQVSEVAKSYSKYDKKRQWVRQPLLPPSTGWQPAHTLGMPKSFALGLQSHKRLQT
jgi:hypothetical protein